MRVCMFVCVCMCMYVWVHMCVYLGMPYIITCILRHDGALVESMTFNRRVVGSTPVRRETPIQYPCCSRERL